MHTNLRGNLFILHPTARKLSYEILFSVALCLEDIDLELNGLPRCSILAGLELLKLFQA